MENASSDRREHKRYAVADDAICMFNEKVGRIINISEGGMAVNFLLDEPFSEENAVTILCRSKDLFINNIPAKLVHEKDRQRLSMGKFDAQTVGVKFKHLRGAQNDQIKEYVSRLSRRS